ncbi:gliding-motility protein MglA [bacterium]|nr:gliding-motility protein MglA [bacterium]
MAIINEETNEIHLKILVIGAQGCGKTTNLQSLYKQTAGDLATRLFDLHGMSARSSFFDFLPLTLGKHQNHDVRAHLYTLPHHTLLPTMNFSLLAGADGAVFIVDSRLSRLPASEENFRRLRELVRVAHKNMNDFPIVIQFNHRDDPQAVPMDALRLAFHLENSPTVEAVAVQDIGTVESLDALADLILNHMEVPAPVDAGLA